jgi:bifunctional DNA-binding transcriptional regulator/antitoxin component of YhaV-PrlF toxin-antitoxin module
MVSAQNTSKAVKAHPIRLRGRGQITLPQEVRENLKVVEGDVLALIQVGDVIMLTPRQPQVHRLGDRIVAMMEAEGVSLADLLSGLEEEREAIWRERQSDA